MRIVNLSFGVSLFGRLADSLVPRVASEVSVGVGEGIGGKGRLRASRNLDLPSFCLNRGAVVGQRRCHALILSLTPILGIQRRSAPSYLHPNRSPIPAQPLSLTG